MNNFVQSTMQWLKKNVLAPMITSGQRFPETIILSAILGILIVVNNEFLDQVTWMFNLTQSIFLMLPLSFMLVVLHDLINNIKWSLWLDRLLVILLITGFYLYFQSESSEVIRFTLFSNLATGFYLLPVFVPFLFRKKGLEGFIVFVFTLLLTSMFYSFTLFTGISIILGSFSVLFNVNIELSVYTNILTIIITFILIPVFVSGYPTFKQTFSYEGISVIWKRVFSSVIAPVISVFSLLIVLYLFTFFLGNNNYDVGIYTFSTLVIAFGGLASHVVLKANPSPNGIESLFVKFFPWLLLVVMIGFYVELIRAGTSEYFSLPIFIQLYLGLWPISYVVSNLIQPKYATDVGLLTLVSLYVLIPLTPFINVVNLSIVSLEAKLTSVLEDLDMLENGEIIAREEIPQSSYALIFDLVGQMSNLGVEKFDILPDEFIFPLNFDATFGTREPFDNESESYVYGLDQPIVDLSSFDYDYFLNLQDLSFLMDDGYVSGDLTLSYDEEVINTFLLTITIDQLTEMIDLFDQVANVLNVRHGNINSNEFSVEELKVIVDTPSFSITFYVVYLTFYEDINGNRLTLNSYVGINQK